ncbi:MAG: tetratricopeptide repeat protein [Gemmatimonadota bacterium]
MVDTLEREIATLRALIGSDRDPEGRAFAPLADALRRMGRHEEALEILAEGLERHPSFASGHVVAGRVHRDRGETDDAVAAFRRVLDLDGDNVMALHGLGRMLVARGHSQEAGELLSRAAELGYTTDLVEEGLPAAQDDGQPHAGEEPEMIVEVSTPPFEEADASVDDEPAFAVEGPRTRTMAELYVQQGLPDRALAVYEHLARERPEDEEIGARIEELRRRLAEDGEEAEEAEEVSPSDREVEAVALGMTESGHSEPVDSPFSWTAREGDDDAETPRDPEAEPISSYFAALLAYEPGVGREARPAHDGEGAATLDIGTLAPDDPGEDR